MAKDVRKITMKYWNAIPEDSRYRALRKVFSNFSDSINRDYAKEKAKDLEDWIWKLITRHVKQPKNDSHYKTVIDNTWLP